LPAALATIMGIEGETIFCWIDASGWPSSPLRLLSLLALATCPLKNSKIGIQVKQNKGDWKKIVKEYTIMRHDISNDGLTIAIGLQGGGQWLLESP
jgi:hypothetical protein